MKNVFSRTCLAMLCTIFVASLANAQLVKAPTPEEELTATLRDTKKANTDVVIIYKDGKVVYEYYAREYSPTVKHLSWSTAKTMSGILIGIAEAEGLLSFNDPVKKYFPNAHTDARIIDVLGMSSGIKFKEAYEGLPLDLDLTNMMYLDGHTKGYVDYMVNQPPSPTGLPGQYFNYSSGDTNLLLGILQKAINNKQAYDKYPWTKLFNPMGIEATFEQDIADTFVGASYIYMTPPDFLKMGQLLMNKGMYNGKRIIPAKYWELMNRVADGVQVKVQEGNPENKAYSAQAITNLPIEGRHQASAYNDLPLDSVIMYGFQGQIVMASPSQKLVMVKLSMDKEDFDRLAFYAAVKKFMFAKGFKYETVGDTNPSPDRPNEDKPDPGIPSNSGFISSFPHMMRGYTAKEYCSCRLVIGRSEEVCKQDLHAILPTLPSLTIEDNKVISRIKPFKQMGIAEYRGKEYGCTLVQSE